MAHIFSLPLLFLSISFLYSFLRTVFLSYSSTHTNPILFKTYCIIEHNMQDLGSKSVSKGLLIG